MDNHLIKAAVVTVSDTRKPENDISGQRLSELLKRANAVVVTAVIVTDDLDGLRKTLCDLSDRGDVNLIVTTGGTGFGPRDNAPEATRAVIQREAPGIAEAMRRETATATPLAMLSRGVAGIRGKTLIINFPGSPKAVEECFAVVTPVLNHAVSLICGDTKH